MILPRLFKDGEPGPLSREEEREDTALFRACWYRAFLTELELRGLLSHEQCSRIREILREEAAP